MKLSNIYSHVVDCMRSGNCDVSGNNEIGMRCPGCGDDEHFSINGRTGLFNCFKCPIGGNLKPEIGKHLSEWRKLVRVVSGRPTACVTRPSPFCSLDGNTLSDTLQGVVSGKKRSLQEVRAQRELMYCIKRGMTKKQVYDYKVFIKPFDSRVYFPYWNEDGNVVFTMGRAMNNDVKPKTLESGETIKPLFGRHLQIHRNDVFLVEGVFDHFVTPISYATMGSAAISQQITQLVLDGVKRVFLLFDPEAGEEMKNAVLRLAKSHLNVYPLILSGGKDPAELGRQIMTNIVNIAIHNCPIRPQPIYFNP